MVSRDEIRKLGQLARLGIKDSEIKKLQKDLERILEFVSKLSSCDDQDGKGYPISQGYRISTGSSQDRNILREDEESHKPDLYFGGELIKVKKVL